MDNKKPVTWLGTPPHACDICGRSPIGDSFVDGKTKVGPWACMCLSCHSSQGVGLGTGKGQKFTFDKTSRTWVKVER